MRGLASVSWFLFATVLLGFAQRGADGFLRRSAGQGRDHQLIEQHDAEQMLNKIYKGLHSNEVSDDGLLAEADDAAFTKLYGNSALEAEGYGEVTFQGLATLLADGDVRHGSFIDLGSGLGRSVIYACLAGGFVHCDGVELSNDRSEVAKKALAQVDALAPAATKRINLIHGDMLAYSEYFDHDVILANNLLLPDTVQNGIAQHFSKTSPPGAVLFTTKQVPIPAGVASMKQTVAGVTWEQGGKDFWFKYVKHS